MVLAASLGRGHSSAERKEPVLPTLPTQAALRKGFAVVQPVKLLRISNITSGVHNWLVSLRPNVLAGCSISWNVWQELLAFSSLSDAAQCLLEDTNPLL